VFSQCDWQMPNPCAVDIVRLQFLLALLRLYSKLQGTKKAVFQQMPIFCAIISTSSRPIAPHAGIH
jgi:hypothetical protein